jgi:PPK2 family polyphosphate:nucleotide phosphotransferase
MPLAPVVPGSTVRLTDAGASPPDDAPSKADAHGRTDQLCAKLDAFQTALYAEGKRALLVVLQGRDTSGKDGVIRRVFGPLSPQGFSVTSFKVPTPVELAHDYLWRAHQAMPPKGTIGVFNRSHYEDVLVVRVHELVPESVWRPRYDQIVQFERYLVANGTAILKFFLHVSRKEQRQRLLDRLEDPTKYWKFSAGDLAERDRWDAYTAAYEEALSRTSTAEAPWYVVPADKNHYRDLVVAEVVEAALRGMNPVYPGPPDGLERFRQALA